MKRLTCQTVHLQPLTATAKRLDKFVSPTVGTTRHRVAVARLGKLRRLVREPDMHGTQKNDDLDKSGELLVGGNGWVSPATQLNLGGKTWII